MKEKDLIRQRKIVFVLAGVFSLVLLGLGLMAIFSGHFAGTTKQGKFFSVDGTTAQWMGGVQICLGMMMLILVMPNKTAVLRWGIVWGILFAACLIAAIYTK